MARKVSEIEINSETSREDLELCASAASRALPKLGVALIELSGTRWCAFAASGAELRLTP